MNRFHAHIYFENKNLADAHQLASQIQSISVFGYAGLFENPIGPHPLGMIEVHFSDRVYDFAVNWLAQHRGELSVLIHRDTGDDVKDHTDGILWLGPPVALDFSFFELIKEHPELQIHPVS